MYLMNKGLLYKLRTIYFKKILKKYKLNEKTGMLDYGCGPCDMVICTKDFGIDICGIDLSEYSVHLATERGVNVIQGDYNNMPYEKNSFDVIFLQSIIEHMFNPVEALITLRNYLKSNGLLIISAPTPSSDFWDDPTHIRPYTPKSFKYLSQLAGFTIVQISYVFSFILGLNLKAAWIYKFLNMFPFPLGSKIFCVLKKTIPPE